MKPFYKIPFTKGTWYITTRDIIGLVEEIPRGTVLKYHSTAHSIYDGIIGFFFEDKDGNGYRWDLEEGLDPVIESKGKFIIK